MKFSAVTLFATGAVAGLVGRQASVFQDALESVTQAVQALDDGINNFAGAADAVTLQQASEAAITAIQEATANVQGAEPISINEAVPLTTPLQTLSDLVVQTVNDAVAQRPAFDEAGVSGVVYDELVKQQQAANEFSQASLDKLDDAAAQIAQGLIDPINEALQSGVDAFADASTGTDPEPTAEPTEEPTVEPTAEPTEEPTSEPEPTEDAPTYTPTDAPETTETPAPYDPNGAATNAVSFGAIAIAAVAAIAAL